MRIKSNLSQRAVRERFNLIQGRFKENEKTELAASGISVPEQDELDVLLEDIAERERDAIAEASEKKGQEKATAEDIRNQALERMGQTKKRKSEDGQEPKERKSRRSSNEALQFMQEKAESDKAFREEELNIRKKEETKAAQFQAMLPQQQSFLQAMTQQQAQQQKQNQHLQMLTAQRSQALMSVLEKLFLKE